jgi:DNA-binding response OmpR family regulator
MSRLLENVRVLLVEDDPIIGLDIRATLEEEAAIVIGPAHDLASATLLLQRGAFDVAVLDHLIVGGDSLPIADELARRGSRFLFHTSHRGNLQERYPDAPVIDKPSRPGELVAAVRALVDTSRLRR